MKTQRIRRTGLTVIQMIGSRENRANPVLLFYSSDDSSLGNFNVLGKAGTTASSDEIAMNVKMDLIMLNFFPVGKLSASFSCLVFLVATDQRACRAGLSRRS